VPKRDKNTLTGTNQRLTIFDARYLLLQV